jgi:hypothetical protein
MQTLAGALTIDLTTRDGVVRAVDIASTRPQVADRLLAGQSAVAAIAVVPRLFSVCGRAQGIAAELALHASRIELRQRDERELGVRVAGSTVEDIARSRRIETEIAQEYLWRALLDWPQQVGLTADPTALAALRRALDADPAGTAPATREALRDVVERHVLGGDAQAWYAHEHVPAFEIWIAQAPTAAARLLGAVQRDGARHGAPAVPAEVPLLPALTDAAVLRSLAAVLADDPHFARLPTWSARPAETGAVARMHGHPLVAALQSAYGRSTLTRLAARITELARIACGAPAPTPLFGWMPLPAAGGLLRGLGWVETARGVLAHLIDAEGSARNERIVHYRILAPTEWNFHPRGALAAGLLGAHVGDEAELRRRAQWLVQALDPCVAHELRLHAEAAHA